MGLERPEGARSVARRCFASGCSHTAQRFCVRFGRRTASRDLDSGSPDSEGWQLRQASVESRQVQLQELRQMLNDVRETTPEEMRQIRQASNVRPEPMATADAVDGVVQELHDAIGRNVRLARREAVLEAYCEEQNKILRCVESSESRLKDCEAQESGKIEELKQAKLAAEREALEMKVSWRKDRMELHRVQMELQQAQQAVANLQEQLSEVAQKEEAQRGLLQSARVTDIQATVWQSKVANQAKDLERLKSRTVSKPGGMGCRCQAGGIATGAAKEDFPGTMCGATGEAGQVQGGVLRKGPGVASREDPA